MMFCATDGLQKYSISTYKYVFRAKSMKFFIGFARDTRFLGEIDMILYRFRPK